MPTSASAAVPLVVQLLSSMPAEEQTALLESCTLAHQIGECIPAPRARAQDTLRATVEFTSETRVTLEVTDTDPWRSLYASRELFFEPNDDREERARAIGLALGVLSSTLTKGRVAATSEPDDDPAEDDNEEEELSSSGSWTSTPEVTDAPANNWMVSGFAGVGLSPKWGALGLLGGVSGAMFMKPGWGGIIHTSAMLTPGAADRPRLTAYSAGVGPVLRWSGDKIFLWGSFTGGVLWTRARLVGVSGDFATGEHLSPVAGLGLTLGSYITEHWALTINPTVDVALSPTEILVDETLLGNTGSMRAVLSLGVLWADR